MGEKENKRTRDKKRKEKKMQRKCILMEDDVE